MKGILLAGGTGSRLYPLTKCINKHLLPIGKKPMAQWNIQKFVKAGITDVLVVSGQEQCGSIIQQFGDGRDLGCDITYKVQSKAGGIAQALALAEAFVGGDTMCVILGDNIFSMGLSGIRDTFREGACIFLKEVPDPQRYGVAEIGEIGGDGCVDVRSIEEKPANPKTDFAVTGVYCYDRTVFDKIRSITPSARGELEITDVNNAYIREKKMVARFMKEDDFWSDAGTFDSYIYVNDYMKFKGK